MKQQNVKTRKEEMDKCVAVVVGLAGRSSYRRFHTEIEKNWYECKQSKAKALLYKKKEAAEIETRKTSGRKPKYETVKYIGWFCDGRQSGTQQQRLFFFFFFHFKGPNEWMTLRIFPATAKAIFDARSIKLSLVDAGFDAERVCVRARERVFGLAPLVLVHAVCHGVPAHPLSLHVSRSFVGRHSEHCGARFVPQTDQPATLRIWPIYGCWPLAEPEIYCLRNRNSSRICVWNIVVFWWIALRDSKETRLRRDENLLMRIGLFKTEFGNYIACFVFSENIKRPWRAVLETLISGTEEEKQESRLSWPNSVVFEQDYILRISVFLFPPVQDAFDSSST